MKAPPSSADDGGAVPSPRSADDPAGEGTRPPFPDDARTGLPGLRRWCSVYIVVLAIFVTWIALLTWLTEAYS